MFHVGCSATPDQKSSMFEFFWYFWTSPAIYCQTLLNEPMEDVQLRLQLSPPQTKHCLRCQARPQCILGFAESRRINLVHPLSLQIFKSEHPCHNGDRHERPKYLDVFKVQMKRIEVLDTRNNSLWVASKTFEKKDTSQTEMQQYNTDRNGISRAGTS